jgi:hypothetical protein
MPLQEDLLELEKIDRRAAKALSDEDVAGLIEAVQEGSITRLSVKIVLLGLEKHIFQKHFQMYH